MSRFTFRCPVWRATEPSDWVTKWASLYAGDDNAEHHALIEKDGLLSGDDLERVGRWKEGCPRGHNGWKAGTPRAYDIWMEAKAQPPTCPAEDSIEHFLADWSEKKFWAGKKKDGRDLVHRFGLSRATTLLHFISGGRYPILDSRVKAAMARLGSPIDMTISGYSSFCLLFSEIAAACGVTGKKGSRKLDNALFCYGLDSISLGWIDSGQPDGVKI
jgi:hypothetical protein